MSSDLDDDLDDELGAGGTRYKADATGRIPIPESERRMGRFVSAGLMTAILGEAALRFTPTGRQLLARGGGPTVRLISMPVLLGIEYATCMYVLPAPKPSYRSDAAIELSAKLIPERNPFTGQPFQNSPHEYLRQKQLQQLKQQREAQMRAAQSGVAVPLPPLPPLQSGVPDWLYAAFSGMAVGPFVEVMLAATGLRTHPRIAAALPFWRRRFPIYVVSTALTTALTVAWDSFEDDKSAPPLKQRTKQ